MKAVRKGSLLIVALSIFILCFAFSSSAERAILDLGDCGDNVTWVLYNDGELVISGEGSMEDYLSADDIRAPWYPYWREVTSIIIEPGVKNIGDEAFFYFTKVKSVSIPNTIEKIGCYAFDCCFELTELKIPESVLEISEEAFQSCYAIDEFIVNENNPNYMCENGVLFDKNKTVLLAFPVSSSLTEYTIPDTVERIAKGAFYNCENLYEINLGSKIKEIGWNAFYYCSKLKEITLPDSVVSVGDRAFGYCTNLQDINIGKSVEVLGYECLDECLNIKYIEVDENNVCFSNDQYGALFDKEKKNLIKYPSGSTEKEYILPNTTECIGKDAFNCAYNICNVVLPDSLKTIKNCAFMYCTSLKNINIPDSVNEVEGYAFMFSGLETAKVSKNAEIGHGQFSSCEKLVEIVIPEGVTNIYSDAFSCCYSLKSITIPHSVSFIYSNAFDSCVVLQDVYYYGTEEEWNNITIYSGNEYLTEANIHYLNSEEHEHDYVVIEYIKPSCLDEGKVSCECDCGDGYEETIPATGHIFDHEEKNCKVCGFDRTENCDCMCHKDGFMGFIYKIVRIFWKLFRTNEVCECGVSHY